MQQHYKKITKGALIAYIAIVFCFVILPVVYAFTGAFRGSTPSVWWENFWPKDFSLESFTLAFERIDLLHQIFNSAIVTICQTGLQVITGILAAAALVFGNLKRPNLVFGLIMLTMMLPSESIIVSRFVLINNLGLFDTLVAVFIPFAAAAFTIFLLRQRFLSFPMEVYEAALLDGSSPLRFVFKILVPLNRPTIFTVTVTSAISAWNGYLWPLIITETSASRTVQIGISQLSDSEIINPAVVLAGVVIASLPMVLLVLTGNRYLTKGLTEGSGK